MVRPTLTQARAPLVRTLTAHDAQGRAQTVHVPAERALTVYVDKHELVTLMTLGAYPEWLVLGYLLNQGLVQRVEDVHSVSVDWDAGEAGAGVAAVRLHTPRTDWTLSRTVTTGDGTGRAHPPEAGASACPTNPLPPVRLRPRLRLVSRRHARPSGRRRGPSQRA